MGKHKKEKKKHNKHKKQLKNKIKSSSSSSSSDEWVEKSFEEKRLPSPSSSSDENPENVLNKNKAKHDDWMSLSSSFSSFSNSDKHRSREEQRRQEREKQKYNPRECPRELNPYWKDGGDGLPKFKRPQDYDDDKNREHKSSFKNLTKTQSNWRKTTQSLKEESTTTNTKQTSSTVNELEDPNKIAAKLLKAEMLGNEALVKELKEKLEEARKNQNQDNSSVKEVILIETTPQGQVRPLPSQPDVGAKSKKRIQTHSHGERVRYFADDDKYSLKQMFENEKYSTIDEQNREFLDIARRTGKNDNMDDIFTDTVRYEKQKNKRMKKEAIKDNQKIINNVDNCRRCIQSNFMQKHLMVSMGETVYLSLPSHEPLTDNHCLLSSIRHASCSTQLDENEWEEILNFRKALTKMFASEDLDVIFFEMAVNLSRHPHMVIECIPVDRETGGLAPIYFKKAIDECEGEWAQNKKLVSLKGRDVRKAVPKGLPYFFVSFGMEEGFAHVIESERDFPQNFAQEIIGGIMDLHHSKWKRPKNERFEEQSKRVMEFSRKWSKFDCSESNK